MSAEQGQQLPLFIAQEKSGVDLLRIDFCGVPLIFSNARCHTDSHAPLPQLFYQPKCLE